MSAKLGKGLSALMQEDYQDAELSSAAEQESKTSEVNKLPVTSLRSGKYQPRRQFNQGELEELASSISRHGIMQPIVVRKADDGSDSYEIIAGERRWRASKLSGLDYVPVIIRDLSDKEALELALIENIQRSDLSPLEEADGFQKLIAEFSYTQEELGEVVGKSRSHIANLLRLLSLPDDVKQLLEFEKLSMGHARALMTAENISELAQEVVRRGLNVRQTEKLAKGLGVSANPKKSSGDKRSSPKAFEADNTHKNEDIIALEQALAASLGLKVSINDYGQQQGQIVVNYDTLEELDTILRRLGDNI